LKRACALALAAACTLPALADDLIPTHLTGVWGTAESLYAGTTAQSELHVQADGFGVLAGSTAPLIETAGPNKGKPAGRVVLGVPFRARLEGETLVVQPFNPDNPRDTGPSLRCRYEGAGPALHCTGEGKETPNMKRLSASLDPRVAEGIQEMSVKLRAYAGKASALRPTPVTRP